MGGGSSCLKPLSAIRNQIEQQTRAFAGRHAVGIHIRRSDHKTAITESPTHLFIEKMCQKIENNPSVIFYLVTDSIEEKQKLKDLFGDKIITSSQKVERGSKQGIINALVELYTLSHTQEIYGSSGSTFSILAAKIGNIPIEVPIIDDIKNSNKKASAIPLK